MHTIIIYWNEKKNKTTATYNMDESHKYNSKQVSQTQKNTYQSIYIWNSERDKDKIYGYKSGEWYFLRGGNRQYLGERTLEDSECYECPRSFLM